MVTVAVLGHRGMLGRRCVEVLQDRHRVVTFDERWPDGLIAAVEAAKPDWIVNCILGGWGENAVLPFELATLSRLIQPSTDAIGEDTEYARAKAIGEIGEVVIRCSIVDPDGGLLAKVRDAETFTATDDGWNGITALAWAGIAEQVIAAHWSGLIVPASPVTTIAELARAACRVFGWETCVKATRGTRGDSRVLTPTMRLPLIEDQLRAYV